MTAFNRILIVLAVLVSATSAFFLNWGSSNQETSPAYPQYYYHQRLLQPPTAYTDPPVAVSVPSIPVQVPLQAQLAPATVHNVQLVPCLCPVSQDADYDKIVPQEYVVAGHHKTN